MSGIIGIRRPGEARITFVSTNHALQVGETVRIETSAETFAASVVIAADQLPDTIPPVKLVGTVIPTERTANDHQTAQSTEDERYRQRKARFPTLGERLPGGVAIRFNLRHETVDIQNEQGEITTIALNSLVSDNPT